MVTTDRTATNFKKRNIDVAQETPEEMCRRRGGRWDGTKCILPGTQEGAIDSDASAAVAQKDVANQRKKEQERLQKQAEGELPEGFKPDLEKTFTPQEGVIEETPAVDPFADLTPRQKIERERALIETGGLSAAQAVELNQLRQEQAMQGLQLGAQVGQFGELGVDSTGFDLGEAAKAGITSAIPRALQLAVAGATAGALGGTAITPGAGTVIGAVAGFVGGFSSAMISNMKSQRSDTTTAQQRVLDEGKQTMKDWATLAANDPANKARYLAEYNRVSAQISQAYRQMKLDTQRDVLKFETALPNLAEFEAFYAAGGERDTLDVEMRTALAQPAPLEYQLLELAERRKK